MADNLADLITYAKFEDDILRGTISQEVKFSIFILFFCMAKAFQFRLFHWDSHDSELGFSPRTVHVLHSRPTRTMLCQPYWGQGPE